MNVKVLAAIVSLLLVAACGGTIGGNSGGNGVPRFIGGNVAIDVGLQDGSPPASVMDGGRMAFSYGVVLNNVGESDIGPGSPNPYAQVRLEGFLPSVFGTTTAGMTRDLTTAVSGSKLDFSGNRIPGGTATILFAGLNYQGTVPGDLVMNFLTNICYDYENRAAASLCFKSDVQETTADTQICTLRGQKAPGNSGGPVQVTSLVQQPIDAYQLMVNMVIEHVGTGQVYGRGAAETCDPRSSNQNRNVVDVEVTTQDPSVTVVCPTLANSAHGPLTLVQGSPMTVTCTITATNAGGQRAFTDLVTVKMRYRYGETILQPILIQHVGIN